MFNKIIAENTIQKTTQKVFSVKINADIIEELVIVYFVGIIHSDIRIDEEILQQRADLPRLTQSRLLLACILTNNIEILVKGFLTVNMIKLKNLFSVHQSYSDVTDDTL